MSTRDELEAALRARPDDATLLVYADYLQAQGDPRGELIALDMRPPGMSMQSLENRRGQLLETWLGDVFDLHFDAEQQLWLVGDLGSTYATFDCGFIDLHVGEDSTGDHVIPKLLELPVGDYVRRMSLSGTTETLQPLLEKLATRRRPWLQHLSIARWGHAGPLLVERALGDVLAAQTPYLEILDLIGHNVLGQWAHPHLRELGVTGAESIELAVGPPFPALATIDFAFEGHGPTPRGLFSPERFPALRRLDFSRNEPGSELLFRKLGTLAVASQLTRLVLPSIRHHNDFALVQAAIARMTMLRELVVARAYECFGRHADNFVHAWARITSPTPWPWPPRDTLEPRRLSIDGYATDLAVLVETLESQYDELDEDTRAVWYRFWHAIGEADYEQAFTAADLARALDALVRPESLDDLLRHLRARLAHRGEFFVVLRWD